MQSFVVLLACKHVDRNTFLYCARYLVI